MQFRRFEAFIRNMKTILYIFTSGRRTRLEALTNGEESPSEFLFGLPYLRAQGYHVDMLEMDELPYDEKDPLYQSLYQENAELSEHLPWKCHSHLFANYLDRLNQYDVLIAGNENVAFALADCRRRRLVKTPMLFFVMGALAKLPKVKSLHRCRELLKQKPSPSLQELLQSLYPYNKSYKAARVYYQALLESSLAAIFIGEGEYHYGLQHFKGFQEKCLFLPFCIDANFWRPIDDKRQDTSRPYVLFMGKDQNRDFKLAVKIARRLPDIHFKFVTRCIPAKKARPHIEIIAGEWKEMLLTDCEIRDIVQRCSLVILPLKPTLQPSGQSVALQAMACAKPVVITKTRGFWEPNVFIHNQHLRFMTTDKLTAWCQEVTRLLHDRETATRLGRNARKLVEEHSSLQQFGKHLESIIHRTLSQ
ncbi:hypothetical protein CSA56_06255 [candidate division KSB3 bacterium]|uniref:Glycosyl transferase family 1 domain-containing protein n=1 Tax=candidate division KSB3 bacterium TaxID=2044937 RepID=A0A2G6KGX5_9BACT|nr:MAG: hypothetical protein CSA56_06255 [candidate division KSB3 bacterium]